MMNSSISSFDITGLMKESCNKIQVCAVTIENGTWSELVQQRTGEDCELSLIRRSDSVICCYIFHGRDVIRILNCCIKTRRELTSSVQFQNGNNVTPSAKIVKPCFR